MIVADASAVVASLLAGQPTPALRGEELHAPHVIDLEVLHAFRRMEQREDLPIPATVYLAEFRALRLHRYPHEPLARRIWGLRHNLTPYDAASVALAEGLEAPLVTTDARIAAAPGHTAEVRVLG